MSEKFLIVGLGNYEQKYLGNRHNVGFMVVDQICRDNFIQLTFKEKFKGEFAECTLFGTQVILLKPHTYMNLSGKSVAPLAKFHNISVGNIIVIHDELDFHLGKVQSKFGGGLAGHNGLKSIHEDTGSKDFHRIRVGIGRPAVKEEVVRHVLSNFKPEEKKKLEEEIFPATFEALEEIIKKNS
ncbi:MAG: aminoacyl-tRNA hydrolase [Nitrospinae bacterium]|nr:aminoacyl-tRNA hydrolase [Nitrospinota bacterium]